MPCQVRLQLLFFWAGSLLAQDPNYYTAVYAQHPVERVEVKYGDLPLTAVIDSDVSIADSPYVIFLNPTAAVPLLDSHCLVDELVLGYDQLKSKPALVLAQAESWKQELMNARVGQWSIVTPRRTAPEPQCLPFARKRKPAFLPEEQIREFLRPGAEDGGSSDPEAAYFNDVTRWIRDLFRGEKLVRLFMLGGVVPPFDDEIEPDWTKSRKDAYLKRAIEGLHARSVSGLVPFSLDNRREDYSKSVDRLNRKYHGTFAAPFSKTVGEALPKLLELSEKGATVVRFSPPPGNIIYERRKLSVRAIGGGKTTTFYRDFIFSLPGTPRSEMRLSTSAAPPRLPRFVALNPKELRVESKCVYQPTANETDLTRQARLSLRVTRQDGRPMLIQDHAIEVRASYVMVKDGKEMLGRHALSAYQQDGDGICVVDLVPGRTKTTYYVIAFDQRAYRAFWTEVTVLRRSDSEAKSIKK
jgi:hypothetical protein